MELETQLASQVSKSKYFRKHSVEESENREMKGRRDAVPSTQD